MEAFLGTSIEEEVKSYFQNYLKNLEAYVKKVKIIDPATGEERDPDENVLQTVDSALNQISTFERRKELYERIASVIASSVIRGKTFELKDELPELYEAIKRVFFKEKIKLVGGSIDVDMPLPETKGIVRDMIENLKRAGFPERSAKLVIKRLEHMFRKERK
jgi:predicted Ser/Thr protein kinase